MNSGQLGQVLSQSSKKKFCSYKGVQQVQSSNILGTGRNANITKKDKKQDDRDLSYVTCFAYYK